MRASGRLYDVWVGLDSIGGGNARGFNRRARIGTEIQTPKPMHGYLAGEVSRFVFTPDLNSFSRVLRQDLLIEAPAGFMVDDFVVEHTIREGQSTFRRVRGSIGREIEVERTNAGIYTFQIGERGARRLMALVTSIPHIHT